MKNVGEHPGTIRKANATFGLDVPAVISWSNELIDADRVAEAVHLLELNAQHPTRTPWALCEWRELALGLERDGLLLETGQVAVRLYRSLVLTGARHGTAPVHVETTDLVQLA